MAAAKQQPLASGFDHESTAEEVVAGKDLSGQHIIVTGGYAGLGVETVRALAGKGASVIVPVRNREKAEANLADVAGDITLLDMDLGDLASINRFAEQVADRWDHVDILINNAGIMACPQDQVGPGWESQFGTNHMGHFALTREMMPLLEKAPAPRVVALSSTAHKLSDIRWDDLNWEDGDYDKWQAYGQSKTANSLFAVALDKRMRDMGGRAYAAHPGGINTDLGRHLTPADTHAMGWTDAEGNMTEAAKAMFKTPQQGAATATWAATTDAFGDLGGVYCEDCDVAALDPTPEEPVRYKYVEPHAVDEDSAERLWEISERMLTDA